MGHAGNGELPVRLTWRTSGGRPNAYSLQITDDDVPRDLTGTTWECEVRTRPGGALIATCACTVRTQTGDDVGWLDVSIPEAASVDLRDGYVAELVQTAPAEVAWVRWEIDHHPQITVT